MGYPMYNRTCVFCFLPGKCYIAKVKTSATIAPRPLWGGSIEMDKEKIHAY